MTMRQRTDTKVENDAAWQEIKTAICADIDKGAVEYVALVTRTDKGFRFMSVGFPDGRQQLMGYLEAMELPPETAKH